MRSVVLQSWLEFEGIDGHCLEKSRCLEDVKECGKEKKKKSEFAAYISLKGYCNE